MKGRKPLPARLKILNGSKHHFTKAEINRPELPSLGVPEKPDELTGRAAKIWAWAVDVLSERKTISREDGPVLACFCAAYAAALTSKVPSERERARRDVRMLAAELGMTPSSRLRMTPPKQSKEQDEFEAFLGKAGG